MNHGKLLMEVIAYTTSRQYLVSYITTSTFFEMKVISFKSYCEHRACADVNNSDFSNMSTTAQIKHDYYNSNEI